MKTQIHIGMDGTVDITGPEVLEIIIRHDRKIVWINGPDGRCLFRACKIGKLILEDQWEEFSDPPKEGE